MLSKFLLPAFMAAGALAAPLNNRAIQVVNVVDVVTMTVTEGHLPTSAPAPAPAPAPASGGGFLEGPPAPPSPPPAPTTPAFIPPPAPAPSAVIVPAPVQTPAPAPASSSSSSSGSSSGGPTSGGVPLIDTINKWRANYGLNNLEWDDGLASQATTVGQDGGGVNEVHQLISGLNMGQVITPGQANPVPGNQPFSPFEMAYIAWLCEVPTDNQLQASSNNGIAVCPAMQSVLHMEYSDTGHHDIIVTPTWSKAGCGYAANPSANQETAVYQGLWTCNYSQ